MVQTVCSPEEQIASVWRALEELQSSDPFRGQDELVADVRRCLEILEAAHARGEVAPLVCDDATPWGQWVGLAALAAGALRLMSALL